MRHELKELANQLQVLVEKYEEAVAPPTPVHKTPEWRDFCLQVLEDTHGRIRLIDEEPLTAMHILYMNIPDMRLNPPREEERERQLEQLRDIQTVEMRRQWFVGPDLVPLTQGHVNVNRAHEVFGTFDTQNAPNMLRENNETF